jgi:hypothetical protein
LDSVVDSVFTPFFITGVANPLFSGETALRAARLRSPWVRLRANRRDAMEVVNEGDVGRFLKCSKSWNAGIEVVYCRFRSSIV